MRRLLARGLAVVLLLGGGAPALAAHQGGGAGSGPRVGGARGGNPFSDRSEVPRSRVALTGVWTGVREPRACPIAGGAPDTGTSWRGVLDVEWAATADLGLSLSVPVERTEPSCGREEGTGLGDVSLGAKVLLHGADRDRLRVQAGTALTLPTGDEDLDLTLDRVGGRAFGAASWSPGGDELGLFADLGLDWLYDASSGLDVDGALGGAWFPVPWLGLLLEGRVSWVAIARDRVAFHGTLVDEVPGEGDVELRVSPGITLAPSDRWLVSLTFTEGVAGDPLDERSLALELDVFFGGR